MRNSDGSRKGNCHAHENKEENIGIKELENFSDNINLNAFPAKPDITHLLYQRLITNLQSGVLYLRQQLKTSDVFFKEEITCLRNQVDDCLRCSCCSSKKEKMLVFIKNTNLILWKTLVHQKVLKNKKTIHPKKIALVKTKTKKPARVQPGSDLRSEYKTSEQQKASPKRKSKN